ncbi:hypothetical protein ACFP2T_26980 [Plantactinospora solaniradicis]|uniref:Uncharacterized protein n=1 Tax=Plantactinospora solaniradicis TaxID=1723736 RepID=A0ABW1KDG9_9ACTN
MDRINVFDAAVFIPLFLKCRIVVAVPRVGRRGPASGRRARWPHRPPVALDAVYSALTTAWSCAGSNM